MGGSTGNHSLIIKMTEDELREFYKGLRERIKQLRMEWLFEEPSTYEDDDDYDEPFKGENI
jgi:hypothetical protein